MLTRQIGQEGLLCHVCLSACVRARVCVCACVCVFACVPWQQVGGRD